METMRRLGMEVSRVGKKKECQQSGEIDMENETFLHCYKNISANLTRDHHI